jgi:transposase InsO family protein
MEERRMFIEAVRRRDGTMRELCRAFEISRKTGYKWWRRYEAEGLSGLAERSRAPRRHSNAVGVDVLDLLTELRRSRPYWGPRKLLANLVPKWPDLVFPAASTVGELLRRRGLSRPRRRRGRTAVYDGPFEGCTEPNAVWSGDFKGHFCTGDRKRCTPQTIQDAYSRYLLRCEGLIRTDFTAARYVFTSAFAEYGMPLAVRTDNGPPFASRAAGGISRFAIWLIRLGVRPERIQPGKPSQNGRLERLHRTLKEETATPPAGSRLAQQRAFDRFRRQYNEERPHEALGQQPPAHVYRPSPRRFPGRLVDPIYPPHFEVCRVRTDGSVKWAGHHFPVAEVLASEPIGVERTEPGDWRLHYGPLLLGTLTSRGRFKPKR